jgi:hypothetical protein
MRTDKAFFKNHELACEFDRYIFEHPTFADQIPLDALVVLLPKYDRALSEYNLRVAKKNREPDQPLVYVEIDGIKPQKSRLVRPKMKVVENGKRLKVRPQKKHSVSKVF